MQDKVMILESEDGQDFVRVILYPHGWTETKADRLAAEAFKAAQAANPDEWSWEDYVPELEKRGFSVPEGHHGPIWDYER